MQKRHTCPIFLSLSRLKPILEIKGLGKKYRIRSQSRPYLTLRESLFSFLSPSAGKEEFWALKDLSFDVMPGETLGVIGRNGAGKSTLLKILSKITPPSEGRVVSRGRIASLLEVGTGFHPELSGRENIYLNGSILGMRRAEIIKQLDAIVDFSGVAKFIDTPLKHYSSGMQLRLAFAVAAFLEPEILVIDEVLAVGDVEFQKKCLSKMEEVSRSGRTILFVSHQISSIEALCSKGLVLHEGKNMFFGGVQEAISTYFSFFARTQGPAPGTQPAAAGGALSELEVISAEHNNEIYPNDSIIIRGTLLLDDPLSNATIGIVLRNSYNVPVIGINNRNFGSQLGTVQRHRFEILMQKVPIVPGVYDLDLFIGDGMTDVLVFENICKVEISDRNVIAGGRNPDPRLNSFIVNAAEWKVKAL
jgi:lipopolysaccharide transport system ATP-binding protein